MYTNININLYIYSHPLFIHIDRHKNREEYICKDDANNPIIWIKTIDIKSMFNCKRLQ